MTRWCLVLAEWCADRLGSRGDKAGEIDRHQVAALFARGIDGLTGGVILSLTSKANHCYNKTLDKVKGRYYFSNNLNT